MHDIYARGMVRPECDDQDGDDPLLDHLRNVHVLGALMHANAARMQEVSIVLGELPYAWCAGFIAERHLLFAEHTLDALVP